MTGASTIALKGSELPQGPIAPTHGRAEYLCLFVPGVEEWSLVKLSLVKLSRCRLDSP